MPAAVRGAKAESLLCHLALRPQHGAPRESLLCALWPNGDPGLAGQSLNSLVYGLHRSLGTGLGGAPPVVHEDGWYRLNTEAGVGIDAVWFDALTAAGEQRARGGDDGAAAAYYRRAVRLFRGDLCAGSDAYAVVERERLRARHLTLLARLADRDFRAGEYGACLEGALRLLALDPCREDAHRLVMRCYVRLGERAQALRQFRVCERILRGEFDAPPEGGHPGPLRAGAVRARAGLTLRPARPRSAAACRWPSVSAGHQPDLIPSPSAPSCPAQGGMPPWRRLVAAGAVGARPPWRTTAGTCA